MDDDDFLHEFSGRSLNQIIASRTASSAGNPSSADVHGERRRRRRAEREEETADERTQRRRARRAAREEVVDVDAEDDVPPAATAATDDATGGEEAEWEEGDPGFDDSDDDGEACPVDDLMADGAMFTDDDESEGFLSEDSFAESGSTSDEEGSNENSSNDEEEEEEEDASPIRHRHPQRRHRGRYLRDYLDSEDDEVEYDSEEDRREGGHSSRALKSAEVVKFLETLSSVDPSALPEVQPPPLLQQKAQLKPFQQQGYGWLKATEDKWNNRARSSVGRGRDRSSTSRPVRTQTQTQTQTLDAPQNSSGSLENSSSSPLFGGVGTPQFPPAADGTTTVPVDQGSTAQSCGGILADYMGLGKTRTMICLVEATREKRPAIDNLVGTLIRSTGTLIVCPVSLMRQWHLEIKTCTTVQYKPRVLFFYGTTKKKMSLFEIAKYDYVITSYNTLAADVLDGGSITAPTRKISNILWYRIILDEAHYIRNPRSQLSRACCALHSERRWCVTASPIMNRLSDLFALFKFMKIPAFSDPVWFRRNIEIPMGGDANEEMKEKAQRQLQVLLRSILLQREASTLVHGQPILRLPDKEIIEEAIELTAEERDFYQAIHDRAVVKLDTLVRRDTAITSYARAFEMLVRCRQALLHPYIVVAAERIG